jgi:hypothetical protein
MGKGSAVLCVEADHELAELSRRAMPPDIASDPRVAFLEASSVEEALEAALSMGSFRACALCRLSGGEGLFRGLYEAMARELSASFESEWRNRAALMVLGRRWARNIFDNIAALPEIDPRPLPAFPGAVAVCGAGASLEEALPFLASERGRLGIVACDTALGTLLASGVEPDLVVCLEAQAHNLPDFTPLGSRPIALAADLSSHPATFRAIRGGKHLSLVRITRSPFLERVRSAFALSSLPFLDAPPLGSVGVHAYYVARSLTRGPILATGLDFSFERGKSHARGCPSLLAEERRLDRLTRWPGQYAAGFRDRNVRLKPEAAGGREGLWSDPILLSYASLFGSHREAEGGTRSGFYDIRGGGPDIGARRVSLSEAKALLGQESPAARPASDCGDEKTRRDIALGAARTILSDEIDRLSELRAAMHGRKKLSDEAFRALVQGSDYLSWGFPDQERIRDLPQDFKNRLVPQAEWWSMRLEALRESIEE